ncbi:hypothetical protein MPTK1_4g06590 [Marchantia polymorpha subsp. ruderalis]|uniref:Uncharacterized protein n=2 Tax=Marchantia polymorpha TaxID=3197 RepID=A0AAF6B734_MARPO|nr:hypothetical protein MARPO_0125s0004 [Marchantia polymorpha]BBN07818.1 hypothetical protein Mp_4g06590 [Marchantia polymorpha subsp. ruderalis]|eukprot:PTQ30352.1 hypothetical protein MARPO_0125s0004 [Marchantia polymorpha]
MTRLCATTKHIGHSRHYKRASFAAAEYHPSKGGFHLLLKSSDSTKTPRSRFQLARWNTDRVRGDVALSTH